MSNAQPWLFTILSAELLLLLTRSSDLLIICKRPGQRTDSEKEQVERGLWRGFVLDSLVFVPSSCVLLLLLAPLLLSNFDASVKTLPTAKYALVGIMSYGFPFTAIKRIITRIALNTLKEFASLRP